MVGHPDEASLLLAILIRVCDISVKAPKTCTLYSAVTAVVLHYLPSVLKSWIRDNMGFIMKIRIKDVNNIYLFKVPFSGNIPITFA
jgi:hypothetical protein